MAGKGKKVTVDRLHIHRHVRNALGAVNTEQRALRMRHPANLGHRIDGAEHIRHMRHGDQLGAGTDEFGRLLHIEVPLRRNANVAHRGPGALGDLLPGHDVAVVFQDRGHHFIARLQMVQAPGIGHQVQ